MLQTKLKKTKKVNTKRKQITPTDKVLDFILGIDFFKIYILSSLILGGIFLFVGYNILNSDDRVSTVGAADIIDTVTSRPDFASLDDSDIGIQTEGGEDLIASFDCAQAQGENSCRPTAFEESILTKCGTNDENPDQVNMVSVCDTQLNDSDIDDIYISLDQDSLNQAILDEFDDIFTDIGEVQNLSEEERKPLLKAILIGDGALMVEGGELQRDGYVFGIARCEELDTQPDLQACGADCSKQSVTEGGTGIYFASVGGVDQPAANPYFCNVDNVDNPEPPAGDAVLSCNAEGTSIQVANNLVSGFTDPSISDGVATIEADKGAIEFNFELANLDAKMKEVLEDDTIPDGNLVIIYEIRDGIDTYSLRSEPECSGGSCESTIRQLFDIEEDLRDPVADGGRNIPLYQDILHSVQIRRIVYEPQEGGANSTIYNSSTDGEIESCERRFTFEEGPEAPAEPPAGDAVLSCSAEGTKIQVANDLGSDFTDPSISDGVARIEADKGAIAVNFELANLDAKVKQVLGVDSIPEGNLDIIYEIRDGIDTYNLRSEPECSGGSCESTIRQLFDIEADLRAPVIDGGRNIPLYQDILHSVQIRRIVYEPQGGGANSTIYNLSTDGEIESCERRFTFEEGPEAPAEPPAEPGTLATCSLVEDIPEIINPNDGNVNANFRFVKDDNDLSFSYKVILEDATSGENISSVFSKCNSGVGSQCNNEFIIDPDGEFFDPEVQYNIRVELTDETETFTIDGVEYPVSELVDLSGCNTQFSIENVEEQPQPVTAQCASLSVFDADADEQIDQKIFELDESIGIRGDLNKSDDFPDIDWQIKVSDLEDEFAQEVAFPGNDSNYACNSEDCRASSAVISEGDLDPGSYRAYVFLTDPEMYPDSEPEGGDGTPNVDRTYSNPQDLVNEEGEDLFIGNYCVKDFRVVEEESIATCSLDIAGENQPGVDNNFSPNEPINIVVSFDKNNNFPRFNYVVRLDNTSQNQELTNSVVGCNTGTTSCGTNVVFSNEDEENFIPDNAYNVRVEVVDKELGAGDTTNPDLIGRNLSEFVDLSACNRDFNINSRTPENETSTFEISARCELGEDINSYIELDGIQYRVTVPAEPEEGESTTIYFGATHEVRTYNGSDDYKAEIATPSDNEEPGGLDFNEDIIQQYGENIRLIGEKIQIQEADEPVRFTFAGCEVPNPEFAGVEIRKTLVSEDYLEVGSSRTFVIEIENVGNTDITSFDFTDSFYSEYLQFDSAKQIKTNEEIELNLQQSVLDEQRTVLNLSDLPLENDVLEANGGIYRMELKFTTTKNTSETEAGVIDGNDNCATAGNVRVVTEAGDEQLTDISVESCDSFNVLDEDDGDNGGGSSDPLSVNVNKYALTSSANIGQNIRFLAVIYNNSKYAYEDIDFTDQYDSAHLGVRYAKVAKVGMKVGQSFVIDNHNPEIIQQFNSTVPLKINNLQDIQGSLRPGESYVVEITFTAREKSSSTCDLVRATVSAGSLGVNGSDNACTSINIPASPKTGSDYILNVILASAGWGIGTIWYRKAYYS